MNNLNKQANDLLRNRYMVFNIGDIEYCIKLSYVKEILSFIKYTPIPNLPEYIKGVINVRGQIIPVMDLGLRLGHEEIIETDRTCIAVVEYNGNDVGLITDTVSDVLNDIDDEKIMTMNRSEGSGNSFINGIINLDDNMKYVLSLDDVLSCK